MIMCSLGLNVRSYLTREKESPSVRPSRKINLQKRKLLSMECGAKVLLQKLLGKSNYVLYHAKYILNINPNWNFILCQFKMQAQNTKRSPQYKIIIT